MKNKIFPHTFWRPFLDCMPQLFFKPIYVWFLVHLKGPDIPDPSGQLAELIVYITSTRVDLYSHQILLSETITIYTIYGHFEATRLSKLSPCCSKSHTFWRAPNSVDTKFEINLIVGISDNGQISDTDMWTDRCLAFLCPLLTLLPEASFTNCGPFY